jgi:DNA-binding GntR family transcriptional regulator
MMYRVEQQELSERVYSRIKEMILKNQLVSGQKLNQANLAHALGVSRTPLLSAFAKLEKEYLIELVPRRGAFVKKLSLEELKDLYDLRLRLEPLGAFDAAAHATPETLAELENRLVEFQEAVAGQYPFLLQADYEFHMVIMRMSGNVLLHRIISSFNIIVISNLSGLLKPAEQSLEEHRGILQAIRQRDAPLADRLMHEHVLDSRNRLDQKKL